MRKNSIKNVRINQEVQKELSNLIRTEVKDPRINEFTSVVSVEVAPDLKTAKVFISVLGDAESQANTLKGLKSAAPFLRSQLAHNLNMRNTPELIFRVDQSIEYGVTMSHYIEEVTADIPERDENGFIIDEADNASDDVFESIDEDGKFEK